MCAILCSCCFSEEALSKKVMRRGRKLFNTKPGEVSLHKQLEVQPYFDLVHGTVISEQTTGDPIDLGCGPVCTVCVCVCCDGVRV